jgi:FkbM family methyltransferase
VRHVIVDARKRVTGRQERMYHVFGKLQLPDDIFRPAIFSGEEESAVTHKYFKDAAPGFFIEVGASDPVVHSQTYALEQQGWTGVLVEPLPDKARQLRLRRKAQVFQVACSGPEDDGKPLDFYVAGMYSSLRAQSVTAGVTPVDQITVQGMTLDSILSQVRAPASIDFVSIDVEGHEIDVLDGFDLARWLPKILVVEDLLMTPRLNRYLTARGYKWFRRTGLNGWYAPRGSNPAVSLFGQWQFFRKHYLGMPFRRAREMKRNIFNTPIDIT